MSSAPQPEPVGTKEISTTTAVALAPDRDSDNISINTNTTTTNSSSSSAGNNNNNDDDDDNTKNDKNPSNQDGGKNVTTTGTASSDIVSDFAGVPIAGNVGHPFDDGGCFICKSNDRQDLILLCDGCDGEYHTFCIKPPLKKIPDNEWFCRKCKAAGKGVAKPNPAVPPVPRYTGVYWAGATNKGGVHANLWTAKIRRRAGRSEAIIGTYSSEKEAAGAYDAEAKRMFGESYTQLNFPNGKWDDNPDGSEQFIEPEKTNKNDGQTESVDDAMKRGGEASNNISSTSSGIDINGIANDPGWVNVSDVGGRGTSTVRSLEVSSIDASIAASGNVSSSNTSGGSSSGCGTSMSGNFPSGPGIGSTQKDGTAAGNGTTGSITSLSIGASIENAEEIRRDPQKSPSRDSNKANNGGSGDSGDLTPIYPRISVDIPADPGGIGREGSCPSLGREDMNDGHACVAEPGLAVASSPSARKRVKAKWLQEYENVDDVEMALAPSSTRKKKNAAHRDNSRLSLNVSSDSTTSPTSTRDHRSVVTSADAGAGGAAEGRLRDGEANPEARGKEKGKVASKQKVPWEGKDWGGRAFSKTALRQIKDTVRMWAVSDDGTLVGEDGNHFFCSVCGEHGELTCCDFCPRVFHEECLVLGSDSQLAAEHQTDDDPWYCPSCVGAGQINLIAGEKPSWTKEQRQQNKKQPEVVQEEKGSNKTRTKSASSKASKTLKRQRLLSATLPTSTSDVAAASKNAPKRSTAVIPAAMKSPSQTTVNLNDAADLPRPVDRVRVFAPELDNLLLRSLLYDDKYVHVFPKNGPAKKSKVAKDFTQTKAVPLEGEEEGRATTTESVKPGKELIGALTSGPNISPRAGKRPEQAGKINETRLGPPFGGASSPSGVLDGTAVTFGARAMGPFRSGLAATMVEVGLVPDGVTAGSGYSELVEAERALKKEAEKAASVGGGVAATGLTPFGSASADWRSRAPSANKGSSMMGQQWRPHGNSTAGGGAPANGDFMPISIGGSRPAIKKTAKRSTMHAGQERDGVAARSPVGGRGISATGGRGGIGSVINSRARDYMDVEGVDGDEAQGVRVAKRRQGGFVNGPNNIRRIPAGNWNPGGGSGAGRARQDRDGVRSTVKPRLANRLKDSGKKDQNYRLWNLKHMRATQEGVGKVDVCSYCRLPPSGALMVCPNQELAKIHSFCFPCLAAKEDIARTSLINGIVKWDCPACRERKERPQRRSQPPSSLRGAAWAGGGVLTSPGALPHGAEQQVPGSTGRSRETDRTISTWGGRGMNRTLSSSEVPIAVREKEGRSSPTSSSPTGFPAPSSAENSAGMSLRRGNFSGSGGEWRGSEGPAPPAKLTLEQRRLLRLVTTLALDRLQQVDPLDLFKDPVPAGVAGYAEAIPFPIDFSTIRRRSQWNVYGSLTDLALDVQLLCANARAFNGPGTIYHSAATTVFEGAERLWPQAQKLLDCLTAAETKASRHNFRGPAASSDAWPLDGHFVGFELTPANEDAYYMHVAIRRAAATTRAEEEKAVEEAEKSEEVLAGQGLGIKSRGITEKRGRNKKRENNESLNFTAEAAACAASSAALLYTRGEMGYEESLLRDTLSAFKADCTKKALRRTADCAKCEPINPSTLLARMRHTRPPPTPVVRLEAAPDGEFLALEPASSQPGPVGPNPKLEKKNEAAATVTVAPEWRVLQAAHGARQRSGEEAARHMRAFRKFFSEVDSRSRTRLRVGKSAVQGLGVFTTEVIRAHELVAEYAGERVKLEEAKKRAATCRQIKVTDYIVSIDGKIFIDGTRKGSISRFFNHSCAPNCYMKTVVAGKEHVEDKRVCFFSLRDIQEGEEISYSYPAPHTIGLGQVVAQECACRAPGCRGRMSAREQL